MHWLKVSFCLFIEISLFYYSLSDEDFYTFTVKDIKGNDVSLEKYRGKVSLVVNVASECGFTERHYTGLVKAQDILGKKGRFTVLAFPCNQFGAQEPASNSEIAKWAKDNYKVNFPMFSKINVIEDFVPEAWRYLETESGTPPNWNFWKYLVDHSGLVLNAWGPWSDIEEIFPDMKAAVEVAEASAAARGDDSGNSMTDESDEPQKTVEIPIKDHMEL